MKLFVEGGMDILAWGNATEVNWLDSNFKHCWFWKLYVCTPYMEFDRGEVENEGEVILRF